ncbi:MAG: TlpA family protein disulfide reductase [Deltaproteobacteria bacterium]|nr:TlpA family protein disulfide reductase [Deltaproteobacteria bacterium]
MRFHLRLLGGAMVFTLFLVLILFHGCTSKEKEGATAPDFALEDVSGKRVVLQDLRGRYVLIDFWATWCPPCLQSIPELVELHRKYRDQGLVVLGISLDDPRRVDNPSLVAFMEKYRIEYPVLRGTESMVRAYAGAEGMAIPTMVFVNRDGRIVEKIVGFMPGRVETFIKKLLG